VPGGGIMKEQPQFIPCEQCKKFRCGNLILFPKTKGCYTGIPIPGDMEKDRPFEDVAKELGI